MVKVIALKDITDQFKPDLAGKDLTYFRDLSIPFRERLNVYLYLKKESGAWKHIVCKDLNISPMDLEIFLLEDAYKFRSDSLFRSERVHRQLGCDCRNISKGTCTTKMYHKRFFNRPRYDK